MDVVKAILGTIAILITFAAYLPYVRSVLTGTTRPHVFSWIVWGSTTVLAAAAQFAGHGGGGAWPIAISGLIAFGVAWLAFVRRGDITVTVADWTFFGAAMAALPLWWLTADPLWAAVTLTVVDVLGYGPTIRKAYVRPDQEQVLFYVLMAARNAIAIGALATYSLTTVIFPAVVGATCLLFVILVLLRRRTISRGGRRRTSPSGVRRR